MKVSQRRSVAGWRRRPAPRVAAAVAPSHAGTWASRGDRGHGHGIAREQGFVRVEFSLTHSCFRVLVGSRPIRFGWVSKSDTLVFFNRRTRRA